MQYALQVNVICNRFLDCSELANEAQELHRKSRSRTMIRVRVLTLSALLALMALSGTAYAGPGITDKSYWPNESGPSSYKRSTQTEPDSYRARAMYRGGAAAPA